MEKRESFGSRLGFILVSAGCAVGIGNVWKFPYMCGQNGGAAFILIYLVFLTMLSFPILICEYAVGRGSRKSCASSFKVLEPKGSNWHKFGPAAIAGNYLLMAFYTTVAGWMLYYCAMSLRGEFSSHPMSTQEVALYFENMVSSPGIMILWMSIAVLVSFGVCALGVQKGVEKITTVMMIGLLLLIVVLAVNSLMLPGANKGVDFYLIPNFKKMVEQGAGNVVFSAMSQAFFTMSIGIGSMAICGSYKDDKTSLTNDGISVSLLDTFVALMAGLIIIPACFAYRIEPGAGPSLIFITLPNIFNQMKGGHIWGSLFFLFLSCAALSTVVAVFENILSFAMDIWGWSRKKTVIVNAVVVILISLPCIFGFNILSGIQPLGPGSGIMDLEDFIVSNNLLPLGSIVYLLFCVTRYGWGWDNFIAEADKGAGVKFPKVLRVYMTYFLPAIVLIVYLKGYYDTFYSKGMKYFIPWMIFAFALISFVGWIVFGRKKS